MFTRNMVNTSLIWISKFDLDSVKYNYNCRQSKNMGKKIFVSYKYVDQEVVKVNSQLQLRIELWKEELSLKPFIW